MGRVSGKVALVTGAAQGLGAAIARKLAEEGANVVLTDVNLDGVRRQAHEINSVRADSALAIGHDVTSTDQWRDVVLDTREAYGGLNILVNNAGIGSVGSIEEETLETWKRVHEIDVDSVFIGCKAALPLMKQSGGGSIVNISSISGVIAGHNMAAYNSAKAAVRHLSKSIALHCARIGSNVRCNSVHPAFIDTPIIDGMARNGDRDSIVKKLGRQIPLGRIGNPEDVAYAVLYLASDESGFMTGSELRLDGGISAM